MKHIKQIDGLRFIAVFLVLIEHFAISIGRHISAGYYGVDLFFVISGFLITSILLNSKESFGISYKKFLGRRTLRIFPLYYGVIFILFILNQPEIKNYLAYFLTYTFNYAWIYYKIPESSVSPFWSLSVEEQFYVFWPFIVLLLKNHHKTLLTIIVSIIIICFAQMCFNIFTFFTPYNLVGLFPRAGSLSMGALGAFLVYTNKVPLQHLQSKKIEISFYIILVFCLLIKNPIKYPILPICSLFLILKAHYNTFLIKAFNNFLLNTKIVFIGSISYGIYIFHEPLATYFTEYIFNPIWFKIPFASMGKLSVIQYNSWIIKLPLYSILSIGLAHLSFNYFEKPILSLKDKFFKYK